MVKSTAEVVICGAGIAGISAAYHLTVRHEVDEVVLVDSRPPLSLTSDKSTECYRNWWPGPGDAMVSLMNRSIDILESIAEMSGNRINLNRRGYLFASADPARIDAFRTQAEEAASLGAGEVRYHSGSPQDPPYQPAPAAGYRNQPIGSDLITDETLIREHFPYLSEETVSVVHPRRCGWFSAQQLGQWMLEAAKSAGLKLLQAEVEGVQLIEGRVESILLGCGDGPRRILTPNFVNAAGPFLKDVGEMVGVDLPVYAELHGKVSFTDHLDLFPRDAPLLIWTDPVHLPWSEDERKQLGEDPETAFLLCEFAEGVHARPEGGHDSPVVLMLWTYDTDPVKPIFPPKFARHYPEIVLRGLSRMLPALEGYFGRLPKPYVDGGYYTKTRENRPLVGPLPKTGAWIIGALSGYGLMASPACGELLAAHITRSELPRHAEWFLLSRYEDPEYRDLLENWGRSGQL